MPDRDPITPILRRQITDINVLYTTLADSLETIIATRTRGSGPDRRITATDQAVIMQQVSSDLDVIWGAHRGAQSAVRDVVLRDTALARLAPLDDAVSDYRAEMSRTLVERIESEAQS